MESNLNTRYIVRILLFRYPQIHSTCTQLYIFLVSLINSLPWECFLGLVSSSIAGGQVRVHVLQLLAQGVHLILPEKNEQVICGDLNTGFIWITNQWLSFQTICKVMLLWTGLVYQFTQGILFQFMTKLNDARQNNILIHVFSNRWNLASYSSPADLSPGESILSSISFSVQACAKDSSSSEWFQINRMSLSQCWFYLNWLNFAESNGFRSNVEWSSDVVPITLLNYC